MKFSILGISFLLFGSLAYGLDQPSAPVAQPAQECAPIENEKTEFYIARATSRYFEHYQSYLKSGEPGPLMAARACSQSISAYAIPSCAGPRYDQLMKEVEHYSVHDPVASADLAFQLQIDWENRCLLAFQILSANLVREREFSTQFAFTLGALVMAANAAKAPWQTLSYFQTFRKLFARSGLATLGGYVMGSVPATPLTEKERAILAADSKDSKPRLSPADLLTFGIPKDQAPIIELQEKKFLRETISSVSGTAAGTSIFVLFSKAAQKMNSFSKLSKPYKFLALVANFIASWQAGSWLSGQMEPALERRDLAPFEQALGSAVDDFHIKIQAVQLEPQSTDRQKEVLLSLKQLVSKTIELNAARDLKLLEIELEREIQESQLNKESINYSLQKKELDQKTNEQIRSALLRSGYTVHPYVQKYFEKKEVSDLAILAKKHQFLKTSDGLLLQMAAYLESYQKNFISMYAARVFKAQALKYSWIAQRALKGGHP